MLILVGSKAADIHEVNNQLIGDIDFMGTMEDFLKLFPIGIKVHNDFPGKYWVKYRSLHYELECVDDSELSLEIYHKMFDDCKTSTYILGHEVIVSSIDWLYFFKMSHRYKKNSVHFNKTRLDITRLRNAGAVIPDQRLFKLREAETYNYNHPNLNVKKGEFFNPNNFEYVYDHDTIHLAVAFDSGVPAYTKYMKGEVLTSREIFDSLPHEVKIQGVVEEAMVLAIERSQVPFDFKPNYIASFNKAMEKVCTSITSGWFREFAWEHYDECVSYFLSKNSQHNNYVHWFKNARRQGMIADFNKE